MVSVLAGLLVGCASSNPFVDHYDHRLALAQAHAVSAPLVLIRSSYSHALTGSIPYTTCSPPVVVRDRDSKSDAYVTVPGQYQTAYVPYTEVRSDYVALFLGELRPAPLGVFYGDLDTETRQALERNAGGHIDVVIRGSPAFQANVLPGAVVVAIDEQPIETAVGFGRMLRAQSGQSVKLGIIRKGQARVVTVELAAAGS